MGLNFKLIQRTTNTSAADVMHSSSYASAQNKNAFGASGNISFSERQRIEQHRKLVKGYRNAKIAQEVNMMPKAKTYEEELAVEAAINAIEKSREKQSENKRESNSRFEAGGLRKTRFETKNDNSTPVNRLDARQSLAAQRQARAERFDAKARPIPKTGSFGRH